jgi:hypothetical protein
MSHATFLPPAWGIVCQHLTVARVAEGLGVAWNTANDAVLAEGRRVLIEDPHRFDGVRVIGVDEHCWRHTRRGDKYVTVITGLTPIRDGTGPTMLWTSAAAASSRSPAGTAAARATRSMPRGAHPPHRRRAAHREPPPNGPFSQMITRSCYERAVKGCAQAGAGAGRASSRRRRGLAASWSARSRRP